MNVKEKQSDNQTISDSSKCEYCHGTGMYAFEQKASEYAKENGLDHIYGKKDFDIWVSKKCPYCNGGFADNVKEAKKISGIPHTFYDKRMDAFDWDIYIGDNGKPADVTNVKKGINSFVNQFETWEENSMGLFIYSRTKGSGKTFLASCICNELMSTRAMKTRFVNASDLIEISNSGDKNSFDEYKRNPMKLLHECKFLVIDDLGQKNLGSDWLADILYKLLDYRMIHNRITIITANMPVEEIPFEERIKDRINKMCMPMHLPEICVRSKETRANKIELLKKVGLM